MLLITLIGLTFVLVSLLAYLAIATRYRRTMLDMQTRLRSTLAKYESAQSRVADLQVDVTRLRNTVVQRDAELAELRGRM